MDDTPLPRLGPKSSQWLRAAGINTHADLLRAGAAAAYVRVRRQQPAATLNLLWALEAAISDTHWTLISPARRKALKAIVLQLESDTR